MVLLAADGVTGRKIAKEVGLSPQAVCKWRIRFRDLGLSGLDDAERSGRPLVYGPTDRLVLWRKSPRNCPSSPRSGATPSSPRRWRLRASRSRPPRSDGSSPQDDVRPHKVDGLADATRHPRVLGTSSGHLRSLPLAAGERRRALASTRRPPSRPRSASTRRRRCDRGGPSRREFEYIRHGTASLVASLDVATGKVTAKDIVRNDSVTFIAFLEEIEPSIDEGLAIHVVLDNGSSHTSKATKAWLAEHPRFVVHHTPAHASWLNQVECFFSILTRKVLRRGEFSSREDLVAEDARLRRAPQRDREALQVGLRREGGGVIHVQGTSARHH